MPKIKVSDGRKVRLIIKDFKEFTVTPKDELYCPLCCCIVKHEKRFFVEQHVATSTEKALKRQRVLEFPIHVKHLSVLVNTMILQQNLFKLLHQLIYRWQK